jgi:hypothetical protein
MGHLRVVLPGGLLRSANSRSPLAGECTGSAIKPTLAPTAERWTKRKQYAEQPTTN